MKQLLLFSLLIIFNNVTYTQITLTYDDFPDSGDTLRYSTTLPDIITSYQDSGEDFYWDFSHVQHLSQDIEEYISITEINPYLGIIFGFNSYSRSIYDMILDDEFGGFEGLDNIYEVFNKSSNELESNGYVLVYNNFPIPFEFSDVDQVFMFPFEFGSRDSTTYYGSEAFGDSIYYRIQGYRINHGDGWGSVITPYGEFECLRIRTKVYRQDSLYHEDFEEPIVFESTRIEYKWIAKDEKLPVMEVITMLSDSKEYEIPVMIRYRDIYRPDPEPPVADFTVDSNEVIIGDTVFFSNLSGPSHEYNQYHWTFSPNNVEYHEETTNNSVEPVISFTEAGYYDVSLTATNILGSDEKTKTSYIYAEEGVFISGNMSYNDMNVYPNPFKNNIWVKPERSIKKIKISCIKGITILSKHVNITGRDEIVLDLTFLEKGAYIISLYSENSVINKVIIKQGSSKY